MGRLRRVLIPIDWSENARKAFDWYVYSLHEKGTEIILTHFIEGSKPKEIETNELRFHELQEVYETRLLQLEIPHHWTTGTGTKPGEHILNTAKEQKIDMIVMGSRGLSKLQRTIMGSVSDYVLCKASIPVLICKWT